MTTLREVILEEMHTKPVIDAAVEIGERVDFLKTYLLRSGRKGYVLGISGGQDSSLAGRLSQLAVNELKAEGHEVSFLAMRLPYGVQKDEDDAQLALTFIQPDDTVTFDIKPAVDALADTYNAIGIVGISDYAKGNVKARIRMTAQYAYASEYGLLVIGSDHSAEAISGFYTVAGDGQADILPLSGLNKRQGKELLRELGAPARLYEKAPTADLLDGKPGQEDETELGVTYNAIDDYLEGKAIDTADAIAIENRFLATNHKRHLPIAISDTWWK